MDKTTILESWSRERLVSVLSRIADDPEAKPSEVIAACREIARLEGIGEPKEESEEPVDTLHEFLKSMNAGEPPAE